MDEKTIQTNINEATRIFKEALEESYLKKKEPFHGIAIQGLMHFLSGSVQQRRKNDGSLRLQGDIPKTFFDKNCKGLPMKNNDWNIFPAVVLLFQKSEDEINGKK